MAVEKKLSQIGEFGFIKQIREKAFKSNTVLKSIGDDTAVINWPSTKKLLLTTDMLIEDVHFTRDTDAKLIGNKAMATSISDIVAMGGFPKHAVVSLGFPPTLSVQFAMDLFEGLNSTARKYGVSIAGGDTVKSQKIVINVALTGDVNKTELILRSGAKVGDHIFVSDRLGNSLKSGKHLNFTPKVLESQYLVKKFKPTSMIDVSDGLVADLFHLLEESKVGAKIYEKLIPLAEGASLDNALYDGEDFELLFTLNPKQVQKLQNQRKAKYHFFPVGEIVDVKEGFNLVTEDFQVKPLKFKGFTHF